MEAKRKNKRLTAVNNKESEWPEVPEWNLEIPEFNLEVPEWNVEDIKWPEVPEWKF